MGDVTNPRIFTGLEVHVAPVATTAPTTPTAAPSATWVSLGLMTEDDGLTAGRDIETDDHYAQGPDTVVLVRTTRSKEKRTFKVVCLEDTLAVWGLVNPGSTAATAGGVTTRTVKAATAGDPRAFLLTQRDGAIARRFVVPRGEVTEVGDVDSPPDDMQAFELTITVYAASDGTLFYELTNDPAATVED